MMLKNIWIISIVCIVLVQSFTTAQDVCIPCNKQIFSNFLNCLNTKLNQNNFLSRTSEADIVATKDSIIFAVDVMHSKKNRFKERIMVSVLATEMCGLLTNDGSISQSDVIAQVLSAFVRQCYAEETGETNEIFFYEFESLVNSLLKLPPPERKELESDDASQSSATAHSKTFDEDFQNPNGSQEPTNYAYSNADKNNFESNNLNRQQNLLLRNPFLGNQQNEVQTPIEREAATAENQNEYIPVNWQQIRSPSESRDYSLTESKANYEHNAQPTFVNSVNRNNAVFQPNIPPQRQMDSVQPALFSQVDETAWNRPTDYSHSSNIQPEFFSAGMQSTSNTGDVSNSAPINMNQPQKLIEGNGIFNTPELINSYPSEQYPEHSNQYQSISSDQNINNSESNKLTVPSTSDTVRSNSATSSKKHRKKRPNSKKKHRKSKKQQNTKPVVLNQGIDDSVYSRPTDYSSSSASIQENSPTGEQSTTGFENVRSSALTSSSKAYSTYYIPTTKTPSNKRLNSQKMPNKSKKKEYVTTTLPEVTKSEFSSNNSPSTQDFQRSSNGGYSKIKALEFGETIFVVLSKSELFCKIFNKDTSNANAQYQTSQIVNKGMIQCGYSSISEEVAYSCRDAISTVREGSTSQVYSQTIAKAIMIYFYKNDFIEDNNKNQAKSVALAMIQFLPKPFYPQDYETLSEQNQENPRGDSYSEMNYSSQSTENTSSGKSRTNAEDEMYENDNTNYTGKKAEILGEKSKSYSRDLNYKYDSNMNDEERYTSESDEAEESNSNFKNNREYKDRNYESGGIKILTIATDDDEVDCECNEVTADENISDNDRTNTLRPNNYKRNTVGESITYANSDTSDSFNEGNNDSGNDSKVEPLTTNKPLQKKKLKSKKNKGKKKNSTKNPSSQIQNRSKQGKTKDEKNEAKSQSKNRINEMQSAAVASVSGGKFDYELFMETLARLIAETNNNESAWSDEGKVFDVLMESIVALTQLLAKN